MRLKKKKLEIRTLGYFENGPAKSRCQRLFVAWIFFLGAIYFVQIPTHFVRKFLKPKYSKIPHSFQSLNFCIFCELFH